MSDKEIEVVVAEPLPGHAKLAETVGKAVVSVIAAFGEVTAVFVAAYLLSVGKMSPEMAYAIIGGPIVGPLIRRAQGKPVITTTMLALGAMTSFVGHGAAAEVIRRTFLVVALSLGFSFGIQACDKTSVPNTTAWKIHASNLRADLNEAASIVDTAAAYMPMACEVMDKEYCDFIYNLHKEITGMIAAGHIAVDSLEMTGLAVKATTDTVDTAKNAARLFERSINEVTQANRVDAGQ